MGVIHKIGRRKTAVARVYVTEGTGVIVVNKKPFATYFPTATLQYKVLQAMSLTDNVSNFDVKINVYGGGSTGQAKQ
jgi:small subunit ribosomal protein S9